MTVFSSPDPHWPLVTIPNTQSRAMSINGTTYRVSIALPEGNPPAGGFPVMYLLDANASFATVVETNRRLSHRSDATGIGPAIIVGIGHDTDELYATGMRERDYTAQELRLAEGEKKAGGGAEAFYDFIQAQLKPTLRATLPIDPNRQILVGHSLSAYFALWVMVRHTAAFQNYIAVSPSLWRDEHLKSEIAAIDDKVSQVFIAVGEWEETLAPWQAGRSNAEETARRRSQRKMIASSRAFAASLGARIGTERVQFELFLHEDHASVFGIAISRAMRVMLRAS